MRKNTAKQMMLSGKPSIGAMVGLGSPLAAQILSQAGFHHVLVDCQHGVWDDNSAMVAFGSICLGPAIPLARVQQKYAGTLFVADTQGTLVADQWRNEIHPSPDGFRKISTVIHNTIQRALTERSQ